MPCPHLPSPPSHVCGRLAHGLAGICLCVAVGFIVPGTALGQAQPDKEEAKEPAAPLDDRYRPHIAVAEIVGMQDGIAAAAMVQRGLETGLWMGKPVRSARPDKEQITGRCEDRLPLFLNPWEKQAYNYLVNFARQTPPKELADVARHDVLYSNLMSDPGHYRAEPIHLTGKLGRLIKLDAGPTLANEGIKTLHEAWIYPIDKDASSVYCVVFSEQPADNIPLAERFDPAPLVSCDAYFFKILRYEAKDAKDPNKKVRRDAPLLVGRTLAYATTAPKSDEVNSPLTGTLIPAVLIMLGFLIGLFFVLTWWFRRGDKRVQARIREARYSEFIAPTSNDHPVNESTQAPRSGIEQAGGGASPSGN